MCNKQLFICGYQINRNFNKNKFYYFDYGMAYDGVGSWRLGKELPGNVMIFDVDNGSSRHCENCKNSFSIRLETKIWC